MPVCASTTLRITSNKLLQLELSHLQTRDRRDWHTAPPKVHISSKEHLLSLHFISETSANTPPLHVALLPGRKNFNPMSLPILQEVHTAALREETSNIERSTLFVRPHYPGTTPSLRQADQPSSQHKYLRHKIWTEVRICFSSKHTLK